MYYQWDSPNYVFYALVSCENKRIWTVHIGSKARPVCITLNVYKNEPEAILQNISFDSTCASNKPMPRGVGTREMLNSAIFFIAKRFKWVKRISLTDVSSFRCESKTIPISEMSFLLHQKTWYERHFNAMPKAVHLYESLRGAYNSTQWTISEWPLLWDKYFSHFELPEDALYELFQSYPKATDFFVELYKTYGCRPFIGAFQSVYPFLSFLHADISRLEGTLWTISIPNTLPSWFSPVRINKPHEMDWTPPMPQRPKWLGGRAAE